MKEGWEIKKLGEVCDILNGRNQKNVLNENGPYPIYGSGGIMGYADDFICKAGTTIIGRKGSINKPLYVNQDFWNVDTAFGLQPKDVCNSRFLYFLCKSIDFTRYDKGVTIPSLVKSDLLQIKISFPPLPEQTHIVAELDLLNSIIEKKRQQLKELDALSQSIFYDMFGDPVTNEKGFPTTKMENLCNKITKGTTPTSLGFPFTDKGINFIKVEAFTSDNKLDESKFTHISEECNQALSRSILLENDILICIAGATVGKIAIVTKHNLPANTNQACGILRLAKEDVIKLEYLVRFLQSNYMTNEIKGLKKGVAQPNLSLGQLREFKVILPPLSLQQQFADRVAAIESQKQLIQQSLSETETLLQSRMDYYFN